jgi:PAS domain S-box-containing protein
LVSEDVAERRHTLSEAPGPQSSAQQINKAELYELIVDSADDFAIFTVDPGGHVTSWNIGAVRLFGFAEQEILGRSGDTVFTPEDQLAAIPQKERAEAAATGRATDERWHQRKDGSRFWASGLMMPLKTGDGFLKITRDRTEAHAVERRLQENEERFRVLATSIPQLVFRSRPTGDRTWPSPQWIDFTGQSFEESLGKGWLDAVHPADRESTLLAWREAQATGEHYSEQRVWRTAAGEYRWHQTRARPVEGAKDNDWVGTMTDIHELRGLQDRQAVLMAELQHRTRNLLAVVQAIATQTLRKTDSLEVFQEEFDNRLRALSRVQSLLAQFDHQDIDLRRLVEAEILAHGDGAIVPGKVTIGGPAASLPASSAQAVGLALHELATNALKYGALAQPDGKLEVIWDLRAEGVQPLVSLEWRESGVTMPRTGQPRRKGYGTELIERALPYQLKARTRLEHGPDGVRCLITVPVKGDRQEATSE